jgi:multidrug efflux pump subunit AcrA (membrane-fusion protein)
VKPLQVDAAFAPEYREVFATQRRLAPPQLARNLAGLLVLLLLLLGAGLWWTPWVQTAAGSGQLIALDPTGRVQSVNAMVGGRIRRWHVQDGSRVRKGDPLVEIVDQDPLLVQRMEAELAAIRSKLDATRIARETAQLDVDRKQRLYEKGLSARRDVEAATIRFKELKATEAGFRAEVAKAEVQLARQSTQLVTAPRDGVVMRIAAGDTATLVKAGDELVRFAPEPGQRAVEIFVSGLDASLVQPGRHVRLMFEGWPAVQFSGWPSVAIGTFPGVVRFVDPAVSTNGRFRTVVVEDPHAPWPTDRYLRLGGKARGWVVLDTVRLGYEIWRKLNGFPPEPTAAATGAEPSP